jgi:hypothetical protein
MARNRKYWHIVGYDGTHKIYEEKILLGYYSERDMEALLRALVSRAGLALRKLWVPTRRKIRDGTNRIWKFSATQGRNS